MTDKMRRVQLERVIQADTELLHQLDSKSLDKTKAFRRVNARRARNREELADLIAETAEQEQQGAEKVAAAYDYYMCGVECGVDSGEVNERYEAYIALANETYPLE